MASEKDEKGTKLVTKLEAFVDKNGRVPSSASRNGAERRFRNRIDNAMRPKSKILTAAQRKRIEEIKEAYAYRHVVELGSELAYMEQYAKEHGRLPQTDDSNSRTASCAKRVRRAYSEGRFSEDEEETYKRLQKEFGRYSYEDLEELVADFVDFTHAEKRAPRRDGATAQERRIAVCIIRRWNELGNDQRLEIERAKGSVQGSGRVSYSEKILTTALKTAL